MTLPYSRTFEVFASGTNATATVSLPEDSYGAGQVGLQVVTAGFSGTINIQGRPHGSATFVNVPYITLSSGSTNTTTAQLSYTTQTATNSYIVVGPMPVMRVVMTRSAGTLGAWGNYYEHPARLPMNISVGLPQSAWVATHAPAANTVATITKASAGAGLKNVCNAISATLVAGGTAPTAATATLVLRDGASGAGTIVWSHTLSVAATAGTGQIITIGGLAIPGTAATAMTLEFTGAAGANTFESVSMNGSVST